MKLKSLLLFSAVVFLAVTSCKKDTEVNKDTFKIENEKVTPSTQSVIITGSYAYSGAIDGITLELGRQTDLMDADAYRTLIEGTDFSVEVKNLRTNTTYYYRYAVEYGGKTPYYTDIKSFKTQEYNLPEVKSIEVVSVGVNRAEVSGEVVSDGGGDAVTLRGICWSMSHNPSVGDEYANAGEGIGTFTCELTNLQPEKTYYARAFAGNSKGVSYGEELTFVTLAAGSLAEVKTVGITGNANLQATVSGEVTNEGTSVVLERGVCYGKEHYPTTSGLHVSAGTGLGEYTCQLTDLEANATYYVRAYAINSLGIAYGDEMSFVAQTELTVPVVTTQMVSGITQTSATGHGVVVSDGGATVTRRGLCWSTEHNPTVADTHADCGNGVGEFSGMMPRLTDLTTYYVRAYAENAVGMAYGEEVSFTVGDHFHPVLPSIGQFTINGTILTYTIVDDGGADITEHGACWSTTHNPTILDSHVSGGSGTGDFSIELTDLLPGTTYYVRIYAVNSVGVAYSNEMSFTTDPAVTVPTVTTSQVTNITQTTATGGGNVTDDGNATVTERGICWSTSHDPTTSGNHASSGTGMGSFTVEMTGLTPNTTYYVRAYAINNAGTAYGGELSFTTLSDIIEEWLYYDNGTFTGCVGTNGGAVYWGVRFPVNQLTAYAGLTLTRVSIFMDLDGDSGWNYSGNYTVNVYLGGSTAPGTLVSTATEYLPGDMAWHDITLTTPMTIDATQDLWLTFYTSDISYPMSGCDYVGNNNSDFLSLDGTSWEHSIDYGLNYTWMIRGFVTNARGKTMELKPIETKPIETKPHAPLNGKTIQLKSAKQ